MQPLSVRLSIRLALLAPLLAAGVAIWHFHLLPMDALTAPGWLKTTVAIAVGALLGFVLLRGLQTRRPRRSSLTTLPTQWDTACRVIREGVVVLDARQRIVEANPAFCQMTGYAIEELRGQPMSSLPWSPVQDGSEISEKGQATIGESWIADAGQHGRQIRLEGATPRLLRVDSLPLSSGPNGASGTIVCFEDLTPLQQKKSELAALLVTVRESAAKIRQQNFELERLSAHDTLTGCLNRWPFFERLERLWTHAQSGHQELSCLVVDIDELRSINEQHGPSMGDRVIAGVARCLNQSLREEDVLCRLASEEFAVLLPRTSLEAAAKTAETVRRQVSQADFVEVPVTLSIGVTSTAQSEGDSQQLLAQAMECVAHAKRLGRNRFIRSDRLDDPSAGAPIAGPSCSLDAQSTIPFPAVTALVSALAYRDIATAAHSRRVADLCVMLGQRLMSTSACYVLETAALLHDIGKIGVSDTILRKAGPLNQAEWEIMRAHETIGLEILDTSFESAELLSIVKNYRRHFEAAKDGGQPIPLSARILAIADAYDSMVTDHVYRDAFSPSEAIAELRRCSGTQFDPEVVSQFVECVFARNRENSLPFEVDRHAALALGMELEKLAWAVDQQDFPALQQLAGHLAMKSHKHGAPEIAAKAMELETAASQGTDVLGIMRTATELLTYCRAAQGMLIHSDVPRSESVIEGTVDYGLRARPALGA